ncbi:ABC transporter substrate-binding protein [Agriterribacter sp.]|uniref:ABC transporter substrate-binding protein n=1 Tax=Agriterribacter sp. TaxID=2821509 RepID=UPI002CAEE7E3|nr:ABC transporter substrate-binding protein [Agriterribacter sp.]HRO47528.1 ABC transporter substrate-binding protein [Agriterribacter sp.]HRQ17014.1 ABC transporter substrate-binding protein [Agriterribacter sp.]
MKIYKVVSGKCCAISKWPVTIGLLTIIAPCCILFSCAGKKDQGKKIFRYNQPEGISSLDPAFAKNQATMWGVHQLFNTLVEVDDNLQIKPSLCKRWEVSADRLTYTFILRNDVYFHNNIAFPGGKGRKMVAADVAYSLQRIAHTATASPGAWIFNNRVDTAGGFRALNDTTFQLKLLRPFHPILGILSMQYCSVVPHEAIEKYGPGFSRNPCGTGPFRFTRWEEGQVLLMARNDQYFERDSVGKRLPYLDGIKVSFLDNKATEFLEFTQGRLDFINDIDASFKDEVLTKKGELRKEWQGKVMLSKHSFLNTEYLGILADTTNAMLKNHPLKIKAIRQAINYGFNRHKMIMYLRNSLGTPAESGFVPAGLPAYDSSKVKGYYYDVAKARQLLHSAGFPDGKGLPEIKLLTIPIYAELGSFVAKQLEDIGVKVQVEVVQKSLLLEQTAKSQALFFRGSWMADYPDAENYLSVFYGGNPAPPNYTRYKNPAYDKLYEKALLEQDDSTRYEMYRQMDKMIIADAPVVPLWYDMVVRLIHPYVKDFRPNSLNLLELRTVRIEK